MKRAMVILVGVLLMGLAIPAYGGDEISITDGWYTVVWDMGEHSNGGTGENAPWSQELVDWVKTGDLDTQPDLDALDGSIPECGFFQIDVYKIDSERDREKLTAIFDTGTLDWPEDSSIYHSSKKHEKDPEECEQETTTTTEQESTTSTSESSSTTVTSPTTSSVPPSSTPATLAETGAGSSKDLAVVVGLMVAGIATLGLATRFGGEKL